MKSLLTGARDIDQAFIFSVLAVDNIDLVSTDFLKGEHTSSVWDEEVFHVNET